MYFMLVLITILHQTYATLNEKLDRWPLRLIYLRLIEICGRVFVLPAVIIYFVEYIPVSNDPIYDTLLMAVSLFIAGCIFIREMFGLRSNVYDAMRNLTEKCNAADLRVSDLSWVEALAMNLFHFKTFSFTKLLISDYLQRNGAFPVKVRKPLHLKNLSSLMSLLEGRFKAEELKTSKVRNKSQSGLSLSHILQTKSASSRFPEGHESETDIEESREKHGTGLYPRRNGWELFLNGEMESNGYTEDDFQLVQNELLVQSSQSQRSHSHSSNGSARSTTPLKGVEMEMTSSPYHSSKQSSANNSGKQSPFRHNNAKIDSDDEM